MVDTYRGWIPNVTGALSFSAFGEVSHPPRPVSVNRADQLARYIVCYQTRDKSDVQLPFRDVLAPLLFKIQGRIWFVCVGVTSPSVHAGQNYFDGQVYLFHEKKVWNEIVEPKIKEAQNKLHSFHYGRSSTSIADHFHASFKELKAFVAPHSIFNVNFSFQRSGVTTITLPDAMIRAENAPKFPEDGPKKEYMRHLLAAQAFYFLRDIGHRHQHHNPNTDTIVDIHKITDDDDLTWRKLTLFGLYRHIIRYKRRYDAEIFYNALGVLAYARAFRQICCQQLEDEDSKTLPEYLVDELQMSVEAVHSKAMAERSESARHSEIVRNVLLSVFGLALSLGAVIGITNYRIERPSEFLKFIATMWVTEPITSGVVLSLAIYSILIFYGIVDPRRWSLVQTTMRLVQPFQRQATISLFLFVAIACAFVAYVWGT